MFPEDDYTPFGYLDNPFHTWKLNRSGVIRVHPPCGFGWLFPNAHTPIYRASLNIGLEWNHQRLLFPDDWQQQQVRLTCPYHSKNLFRFQWQWQGVAVQVEFWLVAEDALTASIAIENPDDQSAAGALLFQLTVFQDFRRTGLWDFGLTSCFDAQSNCLTTKSFAEGYSFTIKPTIEAIYFQASDEPGELAANGSYRFGPTIDYFATNKNWLTSIVTAPLKISPRSTFEAACVLARGLPHPPSILLPEEALPRSRQVREQKMREDEQFWRSCPQLTGDWPTYWRCGWVYDWETLRMNVRPPAGIFSTPWDAMQIQKPRIVLAETALDMLMLSYAWPELSQTVILGLFRDALGPQVPCAREDGSCNMISADGSECGTSPAWCFPFFCFQSILWRHPDRHWLEQLFPFLESYIDWWLAHRTDDDGWAVYNCSWESGQDASQKFLIEQATGGEIVTHLRAVDLQAAMAQSAEILAAFADFLGQPSHRWLEIRRQFVSKTLSMWQDDWYCDFDTRSQRWIARDEWRDITNLAPYLAGIYTEEQLTKATHWFQYFETHPQLWLEWPSFMFMYLEACWRVGFKDLAARVLWSTVERVYQQWDRRQWQEGEAMPGVAVECWGLEKPLFSEGYGWGATLPMHIIRSVIGFREASALASSFILSPNLPKELLIPGKCYGIDSLKFQDKTFSIQYQVQDQGQINCQLAISSPLPFAMTAMIHNEPQPALTRLPALRHDMQVALPNRTEMQLFLSKTVDS